MHRTGNFLINLIIGLMILAFLASCTTGPSAEAVACRGGAFPINAASSFPASEQTVDAK